MNDSTQQELSTPKSNSTYFVTHQNPSAKHETRPTSHLTTTIAQLVLGLVIILAIVVSVVYQMYKRAKRKGHAEIMKDITAEKDDVELSTALLREPTLDTEWNTAFENQESNNFKGIIPKICVSTERGGFFYILESEADAESTTSNVETTSSNDESTISNDETTFLMAD